jgi:hypothetical protein
MVRKGTIRGPTHGVSGYKTTGKPGDYQFQFHNHGETGQVDVAASRYGLQSHGSFSSTKIRLFNPFFNPPVDFSKPNLGIGYEEPAISEYDENTYRVSSKILSRQYQREGGGQFGSLLKNQIYEGFGQFDPAIQYMLRDKNIDQELEIHQPASVLKHRRVSLTPPIRQNEMQLGTQNPVSEITGTITPSFTNTDDHQTLTQYHTTPVVNTSNISTGTHMASGDASSTGHPQDEIASSTSSSFPLQFIGDLSTPSDRPYSLEPVPPNPELRPTGSTGILRDVTPGLSRVYPRPNQPLQRQL